MNLLTFVCSAYQRYEQAPSRSKMDVDRLSRHTDGFSDFGHSYIEPVLTDEFPS